MSKLLKEEIVLSANVVRNFETIHDELSDRVQILENSREFEIPQIFLPKKDLSLKILRTSGELLKEGRKMHHCVYSYAWEANKTNVFLKLTSPERGTIHLRKKDKTWCIAQAKGVCNAALNKDTLSKLEEWAASL